MYFVNVQLFRKWVAGCERNTYTSVAVAIVATTHTQHHTRRIKKIQNLFRTKRIHTNERLFLYSAQSFSLLRTLFPLCGANVVLWLLMLLLASPPDFPINTLKQSNKYETKRTGKNRSKTNSSTKNEKNITIKTGSYIGKYLIVISVGLAENFLM